MKVKSIYQVIMLIFFIGIGIKLFAAEAVAKSCRDWFNCRQHDDGCMAERWSQTECSIICRTGDPINCRGSEF